MIADLNQSIISIRRKSELVKYAEMIFRMEGSAKELKIRPKVLQAFITEVGSRYRQNFYHNFQHAIDTTFNMAWLLGLPTFQKNLKPFHRFILLVCALVHDVEHPGNDNQWEIKTNSDRAKKYKVKSVLEQHSLWVFQQILKNPEMNIFENFNGKELDKANRLMDELILCTDFSCHAEFIKEMTEGLKSKPIQFKEPKIFSLMMRSLIKAADIGNTAKSFPLARTWGLRVMKENWAQGKKEKAAKVPIGHLNDPANADFYISQAGFIKNQSMALFKLMTEMESKMDVLIEELNNNFLSYERSAKTRKKSLK